MKSANSVENFNPEVLCRKLIYHMNEAVWVGDENEKTVYANPKFCDMVEYDQDEVMGMESYEFWDRESIEMVKTINKEHRLKGLSSSYEGKLLTKGGRKIPVLISGTPLPDGGTVAIITDLTEVKKTQKKEQIFGNAMKYANDAIIVVNKDGDIISWNKGAKIAFGYKKEEIFGKKLTNVFKDIDFDEFRDNSQVLYNLQLNAMHKNGEIINTASTITPVEMDDTDEGVNYLIIARDITSNVRFEEELTLKYQKMKEAYNNLGVLRRQMDYVFDIMELLRERNDNQSVADFIVNSVVMLTRVDACVLRMLDPKEGTLDMVSCFGVAEDWKGKASIDYEESLAKKANETNAPLKIVDIVGDPRYQSKHLARKNNLCSLLLIPLRYQSEFIGTMSLYVGPERKLEIFENEFIEKYARLVEVVMGTMLKAEKS